MGPTFIKLGQTLSTRPDIIGEALSKALSKLQDKVPPANFKRIKYSLEKELKRPLEHIFKNFNDTPVAAASIAQVYQAVTKDGEKVAVKVLRPNIEKKFASDIKLFYFLARFITKSIPSLKRLNLIKMVATLEATVNLETDLRIEAAAADQLRENFLTDDSVYIPNTIWPLTSKRLLVQEWVEGIPVNDKKRLKEAGLDLHKIAQNLAITFFNQAYRDGFFHADIHPGNILVSKEGKIILIDFGIMGSLAYEDRIFVAKTLYGFITRDYKLITDIHFDLGYVPQHQSREAFMLALRSIGEPIIGMPVNKISIGKLLKQLFEISQKFEMTIEPRYLLLQKTLVTVEGTGYSLYPKVNMWQLAEPWIKSWARQNFGVRAQIKQARQTITKLTHDIPKTVDKMLIFFDRAEKHITTQGLEISKAEPNGKKDRIYKLIIIFALGIITGLIIK